MIQRVVGQVAPGPAAASVYAVCNRMPPGNHVNDTRLLCFRRDLRLADNPALCAAAQAADRLLCVYLHDDAEHCGGAAGWWLHRSLAALDDALRARGNRLLIARGPALATLAELCAAHGVGAVHWNRGYEPAQLARDSACKAALRDAGVATHSHPGSLLHEPWDIRRESRDGPAPYRVFSAWWRRASQHIDHPLQALPEQLPPPPDDAGGLSLDALRLCDGRPWQARLGECWRPGEDGAQDALADFIEGPAANYANGRERPGQRGTSRLSPHLHHGELGARHVAHAALRLADGEDRARFLAEIGWRDFAAQLLYHFPQTVAEPLDQRFAHFRWEDDAQALRAWQRGETGVPLVDAGMRELWQTGWMHNRVRMVVASFLCKHLLIHWRHGAAWFMDTLIDADLASNTLGWQWVAGCGADAAPYFRVFNPVAQSRKFDAGGDYLRRWLPALARLPDRHIHAPWEAPQQLLDAAGLRLGRDYPLPIVDLAEGRRRALARFAEIKGA